MPDLNIKNAEAYRLVKELSDETGETLTQAVIVSVRERLGRVRIAPGDDVAGRAQRMMELAKAIHDGAPPGYWDQDFDALLYDDLGLPKSIVDTSALVAIVRQEPDAQVFADLIASAAVARFSAASLVELSIVVDGSRNSTLSGVLDAMLAAPSIVIEPFTGRQAMIARDAYRRFGKGSGHPARLNMGDCFAYALAHDLGEPLLFKGDDFRLTDIELVIEPVKHKRLSEVVASYNAE